MIAGTAQKKGTARRLLLLGYFCCAAVRSATVSISKCSCGGAGMVCTSSGWARMTSRPPTSPSCVSSSPYTAAGKIEGMEKRPSNSQPHIPPGSFSHALISRCRVSTLRKGWSPVRNRQPSLSRQAASPSRRLWLCPSSGCGFSSTVKPARFR